ncbi:LAMI_0G14818g1_1 [Lachancea mirantina]|uniref:LAMI_0G14818g1_1 n=1 Tax=Lachancea mirantina TaxID=1230905 RepID=A0A1G4KC90_9SACH|nr:LAMI_0G14818g1_1 [Lachancea mirantina]
MILKLGIDVGKISPFRSFLPRAQIGRRALQTGSRVYLNYGKLVGPSMDCKSVSVLIRTLPRRRAFHTTKPRRNHNNSHNFPKLKVYRFPPVVGILAVIGVISLTLLILPLFFTFFLPLVVAGIAAYQFNRWKSSNLYGQLYAALRSTKSRMPYKSVYALQRASLNNVFQSNKMPKEMIRGLFDESSKLGKWINEDQSSHANAILQQLNDRVLRAFMKDEQGIREFFLGRNVKEWVQDAYDLDLDTRVFRTRGRNIDGSLVMSMSYPLYLSFRNQGKKHLADVSVVFLDETLHTQPIKLLADLAREDRLCPVVISVSAVKTLIPRQFILTDMLDFADSDHYSVREFKNGQREFTYRE